MGTEQRPSRDDRHMLWPVIATLATIAKTVVEVWKLLLG